MQILSDTVHKGFGGKNCLEQCFPQCLKSKETHIFVPTAKHRCSKSSSHFVYVVVRTLTGDDLHFLCPQSVTVFQEEVVSKQSRISCDK